jgi:UDP-N-acetyl-D-galactosamine dehydrogenase
VVDIVSELKDYTPNVDVYAPHVSAHQALDDYGSSQIDQPQDGDYDAVIIAVAHSDFVAMGAKHIRALGNKNALIYDLKYILQQDQSDLRL